jgi:Tfp pilus assembly protein PilF
MAVFPSRSIPMLDTVLTALREGDFAAAAAAAREAIAADPDRAEAHHLLGLSLRQLGDRAGAEAAVDRALALAPERASFHVSRALLAVQRADAGTARAALDTALQQDPNQLMAYIALAELALASGELDQAEQHLRYAERVAAEHPHVEVMRAQLLLARKQPDAAVKLLAATAQRVPGDALVLGALGLAYLAQRHFAFAEQALRSALELQPQAQQLRFALLHALIAQGRRDEAAEVADVLVAARPRDPRALTVQGQLAAERGKLEDAIAALSTSLRLEPNQPHALDALLGCWLQRGEGAAAIAFLETQVDAQPRLDFAWSALVNLLRGDLPRAAATAARWFAARPESGAAAEVAAQAAEAIEDHAAAARAAEVAVAQRPDALGAQLVLARAELREGRAEAAIGRLEAQLAGAVAPDARAPLAGWLGRACDAAGRPEDAVRYWTQAHGRHGATPPLPPLATTAPSAAPPATAAERGSARTAPVLLWGAPGSGVERVAALLAGVPGRYVLTDRFGPNPRVDAMQEFGVDQAGTADPAAVAEAFGGRWQQGLEALGLTPAQAIDWLPLFDARWLPALQAGLPQARVLLALADPRDMLLSWLAFGSPDGLPAADPLAAADWLALALEQAAALLEQHATPVLVLRAEQLAAAPQQAAADLAAFLELDAPPDLGVLQRAPLPGAGLPTAFGAGAWRRYAEALREPFARLEPIARRLDGA